MDSNNTKTEDKLLLFIHPSSKPCLKLIDIIKNHSKKFNIEVIDISQINTTQIPKEITSLPALVIKNGTELLLGKKVFDHFQNEEIEYVDLNSGSKMFGSSFENFGNIDDDINKSNNIFSSIDEKDMSFGIPEYNENQKNEIDLSKLQEQREYDINKK